MPRTRRTTTSPLCVASTTSPFAENDPSATPEVVERFRAELERLGLRGTVERLPGTRHGFAIADLPVYQREAAERHFERTLDLWTRNLQAQPVGG